MQRAFPAHLPRQWLEHGAFLSEIISRTHSYEAFIVYTFERILNGFCTVDGLVNAVSILIQNVGDSDAHLAPLCLLISNAESTCTNFFF